MKKILSFVLIFVITISLSAVTFASFSDDSVRIYRKNFTDKYINPYDAADGYYYYFEEYYHYTDETESKIDWVLVYAGDMSYTNTRAKKLVDKRIFIEEKTSNPFPFKYAVYDVKEDEFYEIDDSLLTKYDGLSKALRIAKAGLPLGDVDGDKILTVIDAAEIQLCMAELKQFKDSDDISSYQDMGGQLKYISDFDNDGVRTVMDASAIQIYLVNEGTDIIEPTEPDEMM